MILNLPLFASLIAITSVSNGFEINNECGNINGEQCGIGKICSKDFDLSCDAGHVVVPLWGRHSYCGGNDCCEDLTTFCRNMTYDEFMRYVGHCNPNSNLCQVSHRDDQLHEPACGCTENCNSRMSAIIYRCEYVPTTAEPTVTTTSPDSPSTEPTTTLSTIETSSSSATPETTTTITPTTISTTILTQSSMDQTSSTTITSTTQTTAKITTAEDFTSTITPSVTTNGSSTSSTIAHPTTSRITATEKATTHEYEATTAEIGSSSTSMVEILTTDYTEDGGTSTSIRSSSPATTTASTSPQWTTSGETTDWVTTEDSPDGGDSEPLFLVLGVLLLLVLILAVVAAICVYSRRKSAPSRSDSKIKLESGTSFVNEEYALSTKSPTCGWPDVVPEKDAYGHIEKCPPHDEEGELEDYYGVAAAPHPGLVQQADRFQAAAGAGGGAMDAGDGEDIFSVPPAGAAPGQDGDYGTYADASGIMTDEYDYVTHEGSAQKQAKDTDGIEEDYYAVSQPTDPHHVQHPDRFQPTAASSSQVEQSEEYDYAYGHMLGGPMRMQEGTINPGRAIELKPDPASEKNPKQIETNETLMSDNPVYG